MVSFFISMSLPCRLRYACGHLSLSAKKLLLKLKYTFPDKDFTEIEKKLNGKKFFYIEKKLIPERYQQVKLLGEKSIRMEKKIILIKS